MIPVAQEVAEDGVISIANGNIQKKILKEGTGQTPTDRSDVTGQTRGTRSERVKEQAVVT